MKLIGLITKDTKEENQNKRIIIALRILCIICFVAFIADMIPVAAGIIREYPFRVSFLFFANIMVFLFTYRLKTRTSLICFIAYVFVWSLAMMPVLGWSAGMQNYHIIILMLCFFATYSKALYKFIYAGLVLVFRGVTVILVSGIKSDLVVSGSAVDKYMQITNISAVFISIVLLSYLFSREENEAEGKLIKYNDKLKREANTDKLTGLFNRRRADEYLEELIEGKDHDSVSVTIGDIDFFKKVNDNYGHDAGDVVLKRIAELMTANIGESAFIARWGGEEFLLILPGCNGDDAYIAIERLRETIEHTEIAVNDDLKIKVTMTFGIAELSYVAGVEASVKEADEKLYMGKQSGRNRVIY